MDSNNHADLTQKTITTLENIPQIKRFTRFSILVSHFVRVHQKLCLAIVAALALWFISGKVQDMLMQWHQTKLTIAQGELSAQQDKNRQQAEANAALAQQAEKAAADFKELSSRLLAQNNQLEKQNAALTDKLHSQQAADANLPPTELGKRIEELAALPPQSVTPTGDGFTLTNKAGVGIAQALEQVSILTQQLANVKAEKENDDKLLAKQDGVVATLNQRIGGLETLVAGKDKEIQKADGVCKEQLKVQHDRDVKGKRKWFIAGFVSGLLVKPIVKAFGL